MCSMPTVVNVSNCDLSDVCRHYTRLSFHQQLTCVCFPFRPLHACERNGWQQWFRVTQGKHKRKDKIQLPVNNRLCIFDCQFWKKNSKLPSFLSIWHILTLCEWYVYTINFSFINNAIFIYDLFNCIYRVTR